MAEAPHWDSYGQQETQSTHGVCLHANTPVPHLHEGLLVSSLGEEFYFYSRFLSVRFFSQSALVLCCDCVRGAEVSDQSVVGGHVVRRGAVLHSDGLNANKPLSADL